MTLIVQSSTIYNSQAIGNKPSDHQQTIGLRRCDAHAHTHSHTHTEWNISHKKNEMLPLGATQMDLDNIMPFQINQRQVPYITCMWNLKNSANECIYKTEKDSQRQEPCGYQRGK